ncbi:MAG: extracellular solute-binding protein [Burkholderiaceae bacterium]|nr:extracellular solute-binding protein [Burkholderiaceae bacterium]
MVSKSLSRLLLSLIVGLGLGQALPAAAQGTKWDKAAWLKKLDAAKAAEGNRMIQYDAQPNYANWGGVTAYFKKHYGVDIPPDMKGSSATLAALAKERAATVGDVAYYNAVIAAQAGEQAGVHQAYKPVGWEKIPAECKDPQGRWFCVHQGVIAFIVNTEALKKKNIAVPKCWADLLKPEYKGLVAYDDPTVHGTAWEATFAANVAMGGDTKNIKPGVEYLKKLDVNIQRYARDSSYNATLRGEVAIWLNADGNGYKMKHEDGGPIEVVIPCEGTVATPLAMGMVTWAKRPLLAQAYLDWLFSPEAQGIWSDSFWQPIIPEYMSENARKKMVPLYGNYKSVKAVSILAKQETIDPLKKAWLNEIKKK